MNIVKQISKRGLMENDLLSQLRFAFAADTERFREGFEKVGVEINDDTDLQILVGLHKEGKDISGFVKDENGNQIKFDVPVVLHSILIRPSKINTSGIKFID